MALIGRLRDVFWKKEDKEDITLSDVIRGLQHCVNQSREITSLQYISELQNYLTDKGEPICQTVKIGGGYGMDVPILSLISHEALGLEEMKVSMDLTIKNMGLKSTTQKSDDPDEEDSDVPEDISRTVFAVDLNSAKLEGEYTKLGLSLSFKAGAVPEAVNRIIEKLNGQVTAYLSQNENSEKTINTEEK